jgi:MarR family transcriptional regulator, transcriptional regulator for hemolysin
MPAGPSIGFSVSWIARMLRTRFDARARALGLTRAQWTMMLSIQRREGGTQSEVASHLEINTVTAGRIIDRLEAAGWIERRPDPDDRRANRLYLASAAAPMLDRLSEVGAEEESVMLRGLDEKELATLGGLLDRVISNMKDETIACVPVREDDELVNGSTMSDLA